MAGDTTYTYSYDTVGNILTANGHVYTYGNAEWKDLLTAFDGEPLTYDASGNPTSYYNGTRWAMTWANGRSLTRAESYAGTVDFAYDLNGLRRSKTVGEVVHNYLYAGGKLLRETYGTNTLDFFYDASGMPYALKYNGTVYYYITNLQGDVIQIVNADGETVAAYEYDPYGKVISATGTMAEINPIRYRGYYYDSETGLYYLQSRYYDPPTCRFINADTLASTGQGIIGHNMFAYCNNNPIMRCDATGDFPVAMALLREWVFGDGSKKYYDDDSLIAWEMRKSEKLKDKIDEEIQKFEDKVDYGSGSVHFTAEETDLWLAVRRASYEMTIETETREIGFWIFKRTQTRYVVHIKVSDSYDFDIGNESWDGIGSLLNNLAYKAHENGMGNDFDFEVNFTYETKWT